MYLICLQQDYYSCKTMNIYFIEYQEVFITTFFFVKRTNQIEGFFCVVRSLYQ